MFRYLSDGEKRWLQRQLNQNMFVHQDSVYCDPGLNSGFCLRLGGIHESGVVVACLFVQMSKCLQWYEIIHFTSPPIGFLCPRHQQCQVDISFRHLQLVSVTLAAQQVVEPLKSTSEGAAG